MPYPPSLAGALSRIRASLPPLILYAHNNRVRSLRSDAKHNISKVLCFLVEHMDVSSGRVLWLLSDKQEFCTITVGLVAKKLDLSTKTVQRIFSLLQRLGLLSIEKQPKPEYTSNTVYYCSCVRRITDKLFAVLGILNQLKADRSYSLPKAIGRLIRCVTQKCRYNLTYNQKSIQQQLIDLKEWSSSYNNLSGESPSTL